MDIQQEIQQVFEKREDIPLFYIRQSQLFKLLKYKGHNPI
mgnify:CR=1 FL=1